MNVSILIFTLLIAFQHASVESHEFINFEGPIPDPRCPVSEDPFNPTHLSYPNDCTKFYKCAHGLAYPMKCPSGLHWSVESNRCEYPYIAKCNKTMTLKLIKENSIQHPECPVDEDPEYPTNLAYPGNCTRFYKCQYGYAYAMSCPTGLHWAVQLNRCDYPYVANCEAYNGTTTAPETPNPSPNPEPPIRHPKCPVDEDPKNSTHLAYPGNCTRFYKCQYGYAYAMSCPAGLHWAVQLNRCDYPYVANCEAYNGTTPAPETTNASPKPEAPIRHPKCPVDEDPKNSTHLAYPGNCTRFYKCQYGYAYAMSCPAGLHWAVQLNRCDYPSVANCTKYSQILLENDSDEPIEHNGCPEIDDLEYPKHLPHPDCSKFYKCSNGLAYPLNCPTGQHWSTYLNRCDWPEVAQCVPFNVTSTTEFPSTEDTTISEVTKSTTEDLTPEDTSTPSNTTTESTPSTTTPSTNPPSIHEKCKNLDHTTLLPHPSDCTKFIQCDYGRAHIRKCPVGLHFSVLNNQCQWPEMANCQVDKY